MDLTEKAFNELFPNKKGYLFKLTYGNLRGYNGQIRINYKNIECNLSRKWIPISDDIQIGLIQSLLTRLFKDKRTTINIDLYNSFVKNLHLSIPKDKINPVLEESFSRVNEKYLNNEIEISNLVWSGKSTTLLGSYNYKTDTIKISEVFKVLPKKFLDYVIYHEILHKKHKFYEKNGRNFHHTSTFKKDEQKFENQKELEEDLKKLAQKRKIRLFDFF